jgi:hypothetical protein
MDLEKSGLIGYVKVHNSILSVEYGLITDHREGLRKYLIL